MISLQWQHSRVEPPIDHHGAAAEARTHVRYRPANCLGPPRNRSGALSCMSGKDGALGLVCTAIHFSACFHVQALHGLAGDLCDEVKVHVQVQHRQSGQFTSRGDDEIRY